MKKLYVTITLVSFLVFFTSKTWAQGGVPPAYRGDYNRMMSNITMNNMMDMNRMMNRNWYYGFDYLTNDKYNYQVTMKDNSVLEVKSILYADTVKHKSYLIYVNKSLKKGDPNREKRIYADQTLKISREQFGVKNTYNVYGVATDSCWLFNVVKGKINAYSHLSEVDYLNSFYLRAFQIGDGPIKKIDSAALSSVIQDNPKAMKAFLKKDYYKAIVRYNSSK